jgi:hypothetical protein
MLSITAGSRERAELNWLRWYAAFKVRFYWLVDPALGSVEIFELQGGRYGRAAAATSGAITEVPGCAGLAVDLDALWAELARLTPNE